MREHRLQIQGHDIVVLEYNEHLNTIPLVFIHGIMGSVTNWADIVPPIVHEKFHWYSLSLLGHYPSKYPANFQVQDLTLDLISQVSVEALRQITGGKPALLVGYSTGGFTALTIAHHAPELVHKMLLLEGFAVGKWGFTLAFPQMMANMGGLGQAFFKPYMNFFSRQKALSKLSIGLLMTDTNAAFKNPLTTKTIQAMRDSALQRDASDYLPYFHAMPHMDIRAWLPKIQTETLILHGTKDRIVSPRYAEEMQKHLPNSTLQWIDGSGHVPYLERGADFQRYLTQWLERA